MCPYTQDALQACPQEIHTLEKEKDRPDIHDTFIRIIELVKHKSQPFPGSTALYRRERGKKNVSI